MSGRQRIPLRRSKPVDSDDEDAPSSSLGSAASPNPFLHGPRSGGGSNKRARVSQVADGSSPAGSDDLDGASDGRGTLDTSSLSPDGRGLGKEQKVDEEDDVGADGADDDDDDEENDNEDEHRNEETSPSDVTDADEGTGDESGSGDEGDELPRNTEILAPENYDSGSEDGDEMEDSLHAPPEFAEIPHQPGAIVRVKLINFVTYTNADFEPGPSLNMVIGPNGTGKSTLVCAICLGLGYGPQHLGRAKDIQEFIKNGSNEATIEIELKGRDEDEMNYVIKRRIRMDGAPEFWINGKKSNLKQLKALTAKLSIQIDNLCQFLPQDKVCEFAGLTPVELLRETQRAAAPPKVLEQHDNLKELRKRHRKVEEEQSLEQQELTRKENQQQLLEREVTRLRQREEIQMRIQQLENCVPFQEYRVARQARNDAKAEFSQIKNEFKELEREQAPSLEERTRAEEYHNRVQKWKESAKARYEKNEGTLAIIKRNTIEEYRKGEQEIKEETGAFRTREEKRRKDLKAARVAVQALTRQIENGPEEIDLDKYNEVIGQLADSMSQTRVEVEEKTLKLEECVTEARAITGQLNDTKRRIQDLDNRNSQRAELLGRISRDSYKVYTWLQENEKSGTVEFESKIFGPPLVECNVKDQRYLDEVEQAFQRSDKITFTCTTEADYRKFARLVYGDKSSPGLGVSDVTIKLASQKLEDQQPACPNEEMRNLGFDGWVLDFLDGPSEVLSMLCNEINAYRSAIKLGPLSDQQRTAVQASRISRWVEDRNQNWVTRRSDYGAGAVIVNSRSIRPAEVFKTPQANPEKRRELENEDKSLNERREQKKKQIADITAEVDALGVEFSKLQGERKRLQEEKNLKQKQVREFNGLQARLEDKQKSVEEMEEKGRTFKSDRIKLEKSLLEILKCRVGAAVDYTKYLRELSMYHNEVVESELRVIESHSSLQNIISRNMEIENKLKEGRARLDELRRREAEIKNHAKKCMERCRVMVEKLTPEDREVLSQWEDKSAEDLRRQIQVERDNLDAIHEGNPNVIRQYEQREKEIRETRQRMTVRAVAINELSVAIQELRSAWEPQIDLLINNISEAFSKSFQFINCAGQVQVHKDGLDFEKWAVQILVKFRESEEMQVLTAQRQSGGERAVSTVFYLMALQSLARAPFRVVDEINQGMDPRNERLVHKRMVKIACRKHTSQYFLITPKLLVDLDYHERMKVLCINSGDWVQEDHVMDYNKYLSAGRKLMASA